MTGDDRRPMPAVFFGHGNPMNALTHNRYTEAWRVFGAAVPRPRAILVVSAHWYINATAVTAMPQPRTIHDFYGFPRELFEVEYPAPGLPELVEEISDAAQPTWVGADLDSWGIDLVVGSGNVVHNLGGMDWQLTDGGYDWAQRFDEDARERMTSDPVAVTGLDAHRDFGNAVPTPDHFIPLLYLAGLADAAGHGTDVLVDGYTYGSLSMTAYTLDLDCPQPDAAAGTAAAVPPDVPPDGSNI